MSGSVRLKAKGIIHKNCTVVDKVESHTGIASDTETTIHINWKWTIK